MHERSGVVLNYDYNTVGKEPIDFSRIRVFNNQNRPKRPKHFCILCKDEAVDKRTVRVAEERVYFNLQRHWESFHPEHPRILQIRAAVTGQERRKLVDKLKNEGNQFYNNNFADKTGKISFILIFHQIYLFFINRISKLLIFYKISYFFQDISRCLAYQEPIRSMVPEIIPRVYLARKPRWQSICAITMPGVLERIAAISVACRSTLEVLVCSFPNTPKTP